MLLAFPTRLLNLNAKCIQVSRGMVGRFQDKVSGGKWLAMRLIGRCGMSWRIYSRNGASADDESRRTEKNGGGRVVIWGSRTKHVVTIFRSRRKFTDRDTFIVVRIAKRNFRASAES